MKAAIVLWGALAMMPTFARAEGYPLSLPDARIETYKTVADTKLSLYIFEPATGPTSNRPAIVFFFGGSWSHGTPEMFAPQCRYLASRGMVAIAADYRVATRHQVKPATCVSDAKSAIRWLRANADRLGIDPHRIAAGGGSAGGHIAAAAASLTDFHEPEEDTRISSAPDALVLFNPVMVLAPLEGLDRFGAVRTAEKLGAEPETLSPAHHVKPGMPPTIILHGLADKTVPFASIEAYARLMKAAGNRCEVIGYDGQGHGFFNYGKGDGRYYRETLAAADAFLVSLGYLPPRSDLP